jgi:2,3-bisphosphoglycerate-dependent phosphoglycerate mutase
MITNELLMLRHGEACCNRDGVVGGPATCTGLTLLGRRQVGKAVRRIHADPAIGPVTALYAGPRLRLRETGEIIAPVLGLLLRIDGGLDGPVHGAADGRQWSEVKAEFSGGIHAHPDRPWADGSDTWTGYIERAARGLNELIARHQGERVLLACRGETVMAAFALMLGLNPERAAACRVENASLTWWQRESSRFGIERWLLHRHNDISYRDYLDPDVIG